MEKAKKGHSNAAIIGIGSNSLAMVVGQYSKNGLHILDRLEYPVSLGKDTFSTGVVSFEKINMACKTIKNFLHVAQEYKITKIRAFATTAVREARNQQFIVDQIRIRTGLEVEVLDDSAEKTYIYKEMLRHFKEYKTYRRPALMVYMGVGNLGISCLDNGCIPYTLNIKMGSLRMSELFTSMQDIEEQYVSVIEDYLRGFKATFFSRVAAENFKHFISSGREAVTIAHLSGAEQRNGMFFLLKDKFNEFYHIFESKTNEELMELYEINNDEVFPLRYCLTIYSILLNATTADKIVVLDACVSGGMLFEILQKEEAREFNKEFEANAIISAHTMAGRYAYDKEHTEHVERYCLKIFDKMKAIHGLGPRERLLLQVAAITHDVGKYVNIGKHYNHSYDIINSSEIVGLDSREVRLVANITKYHSMAVPESYHENYRVLPALDKIRVSKLAAILRIAEAMDKGHIRKFDDINIKMKDDTLIIGIETLKNTKIEEWALDLKRDYFETVFGMRVVLRKKRVN